MAIPLQPRSPRPVYETRPVPRPRRPIPLDTIVTSGIRLAWAVLWLWIMVSLFSGTCRYTVTNTASGSSYGFTCQERSTAQVSQRW
jgi:hypothetical protein